MAENDTPTPEQKRKAKWLLLIPIVLLTLLGAYLLHEAFDRDEDRAAQTQTRNEPATPNNSDRITEQEASVSTLNQIHTNEAVSEFIGDQFKLTGVTVSRVRGDRAFLVNDGSVQGYPALLSDTLNNGSQENRVAITPGGRYALSGTIKALPTDTTQLQQQFNLTAQEAQEVSQYGAYLLIEQIERPTT